MITSLGALPDATVTFADLLPETTGRHKIPSRSVYNNNNNNNISIFVIFLNCDKVVAYP